MFSGGLLNPHGSWRRNGKCWSPRRGGGGGKLRNCTFCLVINLPTAFFMAMLTKCVNEAVCSRQMDMWPLPGEPRQNKIIYASMDVNSRRKLQLQVFVHLCHWCFNDHSKYQFSFTCHKRLSGQPTRKIIHQMWCIKKLWPDNLAWELHKEIWVWGRIKCEN